MQMENPSEVEIDLDEIQARPNTSKSPQVPPKAGENILNINIPSNTSITTFDNNINNNINIDLEVPIQSNTDFAQPQPPHTSQQPQFNQIEIPDFDDLPVPTPINSNNFADSPKSIENVPTFPNSNVNPSSNIAGFSFPLQSSSTQDQNNISATNTAGNNNKFHPLSRINSTRSQRNQNQTSDKTNDLILKDFQPMDSLTQQQELDQQQHRKAQVQKAIAASLLNASNTQEVRRLLATELKTPSEYTLHMIFTQFIRLAERKLNTAETTELSIKTIEMLKEGADPLFDKLIMSLGYIAKKKPQQVIDSVMYWRKSKNDLVEISIKAYNKNKHLLMLKQKQVKGTSHNSSSSSKMSLHSRNTSNQSSGTNGRSNYHNNNNSNDINTNESISIQFLESQVEHARQIFVQTENKANISSYLICRVLIEVVKQMPINSINSSFYNSLEDNIYYQLKTMDPNLVLSSKIKLINWNCLTELLGAISAKRFSKISDKFIADLEKIPSTVPGNHETHICLLIHGMNHLKLTNYPLEDFEESCGFLSSLAKFFFKSNNYMVVNSYCETFTRMLLPLCGVLNAETDFPGWVDLVKLVLKKINSMIDKQKYWDNAFTLMCVCLSVSPASIFYKNWFDLIEYNLSSRLYKTSNTIKDNNDYQSFSAILNDKRNPSTTNLNSASKITLIKSLARLIWTYIFRCTESLNKTTKKLDAIFKLLFFQSNSSKKQQWINYDLDLLKPLIILLRSVGYSNINYTMESLLIPLIKLSFNTVTLDNVSQEKLIIVLKAYTFILDDLITNTKPQYPTNEFIESAFDIPSTNINTINIKEILNMKNVDQNDILYHEEISNYFSKLFLLLDNDVGANTWSSSGNSDGGYVNSGHYHHSSTADSVSPITAAISPSFLASKSPFSSFHYFSSDASQQHTKKQLNLELFERMVELIPWFYQLSNVIPYKKLIEVLTRNAVHENSKIAKAAIITLKKMTTKRNSGSLISTFAKFAFNLNEEYNNNTSLKYSTSFLISSSEQYQKLLRIYYDLLCSWLNFLKNKGNIENPNSKKKDEDDFYILNGNFKMNMGGAKGIKDGPGAAANETGNGNGNGQLTDEKDDLELNSIVTTIEQVEGNGLFFLCSRSTPVRRLAVAILKLVPKFDDAIVESSSNKNSNSSSSPKTGPNAASKHASFISTNTTSSTNTSNSNNNNDNSNDNTISGAGAEKTKNSSSKSKYSENSSTRLIYILEAISFFDLITSMKVSLSMPERKRLAVLKTKNRKDLLVRLAEADYGVDLTLWFKSFHRVLGIIFEQSPVTMALCRSIVCARLIQIHEFISEFAEQKVKHGGGIGGLGGSGGGISSSSSGSGGGGGLSSGGIAGGLAGGLGSTGSSKLFFGSNNNNFLDTQPEVLVEQWKLYLIVACTSLTSTSNQELPLPGALSSLTHQRKVSSATIQTNNNNNNNNGNNGNRLPPSFTISSAKQVFKLVIPLLGTEQPLVRDAIISGLSCININIFKALVEVIMPIRANWETEVNKATGSSSTSAKLSSALSSLLANDIHMKIRIEITRILSITSRFLANEPVYTDTKILTEMVSYVKTVRVFLGMAKVQESFEFQKLRRYFCGLLENMFIGVQKTNEPERWFPFEARLGCFTFLEEWCGYGVTSDVAKLRYHAMKQSKKNATSPTFGAAIELERTALEYSALSAMATLCSGAICKTLKSGATGNSNSNSGSNSKAYVVMAIDFNSLVTWIKALFESNEEILHKMGKKGLRNLLSFNQEKQIFNQAVREFFSHNITSKTSESYFVTLCDAILENEEYNCELNEVLVLGLYAINSPLYEIRKMAGKLLVYVEKRFLGKNFAEEFMECICSSAKSVYKKAAANLSQKYSVLHTTEKYHVISLLTMYLYIIPEDSKIDVLTLLLPWIGTIQLLATDYDNAFRGIVDPYTEMVLNNLIEITDRYGEVYMSEVEALWVSLIDTNPENNSKTTLEYIFAVCLHKRNSALVELSKQIVNFVYFSYPDIITTLIKNINPKAMIPPEYRPAAVDAAATMPMPMSNSRINGKKKFPYLYLIPDTENKDMFSLGQICTIFLVDLFKLKPDAEVIIQNLPLLLNLSFVLFDHYLPIVRIHSVELLCSIVHELAYDNDKAKATVDNLRKPDLKYIWTYDDLNNDRNGARTPKNMDQLIRVILEVLSPKFTNLQQDWSRTTLVWATTCSVRHIACRSFQAFRSLLSFLEQEMLRDMLHRLSNTISDPAPDIQGFAMQILMSLNAIIAELSAEKLISFPQLFWSAVACLSTVHEKEFIEVISIISKFISKIDLNSEDTISCLISTFPPNWEGKFEGLQNIVMIGLRSANAWEISLKLLDRLNKLQPSEVIAGPQRLLLALLANMPRFLHAFEEQVFTQDIKDAADILSEMALASNQLGISRIVLSLANNKFRKKEDFISQALFLIKQNYFPDYQLQCLVFLLGLLMNRIRWVKLETLELLKYIFPLIDLTREEFQGVGADLLSPLLRLLLTEFSEKALEVLDETDGISGSQLDKDFIRLSLGNRTLRKEYEKIATLFGVPDDSGWSIPMPAVTAATTRNNVHAVYLTCQNPEDQEEHPQSEGDFQFHVDEREEEVHFYDDKAEKRSISNMYATLNYFESFFETNAAEINGTSVAGGAGSGVDGDDADDTDDVDDVDSLAFSRHHHGSRGHGHGHDRGLLTDTSKMTNYTINDDLTRTESNGSYRLDPFNSNNYSNYNNY